MNVPLNSSYDTDDLEMQKNYVTLQLIHLCTFGCAANRLYTYIYTYVCTYICTYTKSDVLYFTLVHFDILLQNIP